MKLKNYKKKGENIFNDQRTLIKNTLDTYYIKENILDGKQLMDSWFPKIKSHVFLSHAHTDIDFVYKFAGYLKDEFGIMSFIDSAVWGYADDLLKEIDNEHCYQSESKTYNYNKRNITTSNVYLMLNNALFNMIDDTECIIFINTANSVKKISDEIKNRTFSPWIYSELNIINKIREKEPKRQLIKGIEKRAYNIQENLQIAHDISEQIDALHILTVNDINRMSKNKPLPFNRNETLYPEACLDYLYQLKAWLN